MAERLEAGSRFGDYEILGVLGAGGMGVVYRARDVALERLVALKTLSPRLAEDPEFVQRFMREAKVVARLNHPNIVQIYNLGSVDNTYFLAMEFLDGQPLSQHLRGARWPEADAVGLVRQACRALALAHEQGIIHRDIKPDNLVLTKRGEIKLVDLGIAKQLDEDQALTQTGHSLGSPHYISPEQIRGEKSIDGRADIYSLGATFFHMVTGHCPFEADTAPVIMSMHMHDPMPDPRTFVPELSDGLCRVLSRMMAKQRDERYPDVESLDADLQRLLRGETPVASGTTELPDGATRVLPATIAVTGGQQPTNYDSAVLGRLEEMLSGAIGPMAKVIVRQTARNSPTYEKLCDALARQLPAGSERDDFLRRCRTDPALTASVTPPRAATPTPATLAPSMQPTTKTPSPASFAPEQLALLESELAKRIGPLARVLVKKSTRAASSMEDLIERLCESIPDEAGRRAFAAATRHLT